MLVGQFVSQCSSGACLESGKSLSCWCRQVGQTVLGPSRPQERLPTPSTPTPATPHASEPSGGPGKKVPNVDPAWQL